MWCAVNPSVKQNYGVLECLFKFREKHFCWCWGTRSWMPKLSERWASCHLAEGENGKALYLSPQFGVEAFSLAFQQSCGRSTVMEPRNTIDFRKSLLKTDGMHLSGVWVWECDAMHFKVPAILWFCLQRKCADASPVGHISFDPGNGAKSLDQQGQEIWKLAACVWVCLGWWIRSKSLLLFMIVLLTLAKANIRHQVHFRRICSLWSDPANENHFSFCACTYGGKGDGAELDLLNYSIGNIRNNNGFANRPTSWFFWMSGFLQAALKQFGITWAGLYVTWLEEQSFCSRCVLMWFFLYFLVLIWWCWCCLLSDEMSQILCNETSKISDPVLWVCTA